MTSPERPSTRPLDGPLEIDLRRRVDTMLTAPAEATRHVCILILSIDDTGLPPVWLTLGVDGSYAASAAW
ncbi:MAG: hypothetical protein NTZ03_13600 [Actinobacteria bacterium]|nr:hypothetical protein [Actinomycetota bacterium]